MQDKQLLIFNLLDQNAFFRVSKPLVVKLKDFVAAGVLCELVSLMKYYHSKGQLLNGKYFFYTREDIERDFCISHFQQRTILEKLELQGLIESFIPTDSQVRKKYYTVNFDKLVEVLSQEI